MADGPTRALRFGLLLLALGAVGLAAWRRESSPPPESPGITLPPHPYLLWEQTPGERMEGGVRVRVNSLGLRGPEPTLPKPTGVRRILATGDSAVYGFGVAEDDMFVQAAARRLRTTDPGIEGWTAAVPGYSTLQTLNLLQLRALRLEPDVIVIANMWSDYQEGAAADADLIAVVPRADDGSGGGLDRLLPGRALAWIEWWRKDEPAPVGAAGASVARVPPNAYARNLEAIVALAHENGAAVAFLLLPDPEDLPDSGLHPSLSIAQYRQIMRDTAARHGAPVVDGGAALRGGGRPSSELWIDAIHPSVTGQRLLGQALAEALSGWARGDMLEGPGDGRTMPTYDENVRRPPPYVPPR